MTRLFLDFETRNALDIKTVGMDRYARSAEVLMLAWAVNNEDPHLWMPSHGSMLPPILRAVLLRPDVQKVAWNSRFERAIFKHCLNIDSPTAQWLDPAVLARYGTFPGSLAGCSEYLGLGDKAKDKDGRRLITKFSLPRRPTKASREPFNKPEDHPEDWQKFQAYCKQDVIAEREVLHRLENAFSLTPFEQRVCQIDAEINEGGIPVDMQFVNEANKLVLAEKTYLAGMLRDLTGLANPNSGAQMLPWLRERGYPFSSLLKRRVDEALQDTALSATVREVLTLRAKLSRSSTAKLNALLERTGPDGWLRHNYKYLGAMRTGRWSGEGVQLQNFKR